MTIGDARFNLYQPQMRAAAPTASTGRGSYITENITPVEAVTAVRSATNSTSSAALAFDEERATLLASGNDTRGQLVDILV